MTVSCVQSVIDNNDALNVEIIVIDNCPSNGSSRDLREKFDAIPVIDSPVNNGFENANNIGFGFCHG